MFKLWWAKKCKFKSQYNTVLYLSEWLKEKERKCWKILYGTKETHILQVEVEVRVNLWKTFGIICESWRYITPMVPHTSLCTFKISIYSSVPINMSKVFIAVLFMHPKLWTIKIYQNRMDKEVCLYNGTFSQWKCRNYSFV